MTQAAATAALVASTSSGGLLLPVLAAAPQGHNTGGAISADAAGYAFVLDSVASGTPPTVVSGYTDWGSTFFSTTVSIRVSGKVVTNGESITANAGSRRAVRIYTNVDAGDPVDDIQFLSGTTGSAATFPAVTISSGGRLCFGFAKRVGGSTDPAYSAPLDQNQANVNTSASVHSAESNGLLTTLTATGIDLAGGNDWCAVTIVLNGAAA
jgi:hypothetical protein